MKIELQTFFLLLLLLSCVRTFECELHPSYERKIEKDLSYFKTGITQNMINSAKRSQFMTTVVISNQQAQVTGHPMKPTNKVFIRQLAKDLPNMEFVINYLDEPRLLKHPCSPGEDWRKCACDSNYSIPDHGFFIKPCTWKPIYEKMPIFSSGTVPECFADILMPSPHHVKEHFFNARIRWEDKQFKAIWRGASTGGNYQPTRGFRLCPPVPFEQGEPHYSKFHRQKLVGLCKNNSDCDAKFSKYSQCSPQNCEAMRQEYGEISCIQMDNQAINKIIIDIDGNTYSRRFPYLMATGSVILKVAAFEDIGTVPAEPWVHYLPVKMDLSNFNEVLDWAKNNDKELSQIARRGQQLALSSMRPKHYTCYMIKLLLKYQSLIVSEQVYQQNQAKKTASDPY